MKVKRLVKDAFLPSKANKTDAGWDLYAYIPENKICINPNKRVVIRTGIAVQFFQGIAAGVYGRIAPRSGLAVKQGLDVLAGVIDPEYTGEIKVCLYNTGDEPIYINNGDRIAQLIPTLFVMNDSIREVDSFKQTQRGDSGFGSSGK